MEVQAIDYDGSVSNGTEIELSGFASAITITRFAPAMQQTPSPAAVIRIQDESGASPSNYIEATIADGDQLATPVTGSVPIAAAGTIYIRVVTASGGGFIRGHFEFIVGGAATVGALCTIAAVKTYLGITDADNDTLLTSIVEGVSGRMQAYMRRLIVQDSCDEYHSGSGYFEAICVNQPPISGTPTVTIDDAAFDGFTFDPDAGILYYTNGVWPKGRRNIRVQYTGGWSAVPTALREVAIKQAAFEAKLANVRGNKLGIESESDAAGTAIAMSTDQWVVGVRDVLDIYRMPI